MAYIQQIAVHGSGSAKGNNPFVVVYRLDGTEHTYYPTNASFGRLHGLIRRKLVHISTSLYPSFLAISYRKR